MTDTQTATLISGSHAERVEARFAGDRLHVDADALAASTGWELRPEGFCRGDVCVPAHADSRPSHPPVVSGTGVDLLAFADLVRAPIAVDSDTAIVVLGEPAASRAATLRTLEVPDVALPTTGGEDVSVRDLDGKRRMLLAWASW